MSISFCVEQTLWEQGVFLVYGASVRLLWGHLQVK